MYTNLVDVRFRPGQIPESVLFEVAVHHEVDSVFMPKRGRLSVLLPHSMGAHARVHIEVKASGDCTTVICGNGDLELNVQLRTPRRSRHIATKADMHLLGQSRVTAPFSPGRRNLVFEFGPDRLSAFVDDEQVLESGDPHPRDLGRIITLRTWGDIHLHRLHVESLTASRASVPSVSHAPSRENREEFWLEANIDFHGHVCICPFDHNQFDKLVAEHASWGVRRIHWIYYNETRDSWILGANGENPSMRANLHQTLDAVGDIFRTAVQVCHSHGVEIYGLVRPFDSGHLTEIGGRWGNCAPYFAANPEFCSARKPRACGSSMDRPVVRLDLVAEDDAPLGFALSDVRLFVGDEQQRFRPYDGASQLEELVESYPFYVQGSDGVAPTGETRRSRVLRFSGLNIADPHLLIQVAASGGTFVNNLANMVHLFDNVGRQRHITLGLETRPSPDAASDWSRHGVRFDHAADTPSSCFPGYEPMHWPIALDQAGKFLAIARQREQHHVGLGSMAFDEVRQYWLAQVKAVLEAGADGVELRMRNHQSPLSWRDLGFEQPIRDRYMHRHGVDLWQADDQAIDWESLRQIRGDYYTDFVRQTRRLVDTYGRKLGLHVSVSMDMEPAQGAAMETHWNWRRWIEEQLPHSITMKESMCGTALATELLARAGDTPVIYAPYGSLTAHALRGNIKRARLEGFAGYQQYVPLVRGTGTGAIRVLDSEQVAVLRELEWRSSRART